MASDRLRLEPHSRLSGKGLGILLKAYSPPIVLVPQKLLHRLISLGHIASRTKKLDIILLVYTAPGDRDDVINMICGRNISLTHLTFATLNHHQLKNIGSRITITADFLQSALTTDMPSPFLCLDLIWKPFLVTPFIYATFLRVLRPERSITLQLALGISVGILYCLLIRARLAHNIDPKLTTSMFVKLAKRLYDPTNRARFFSRNRPLRYCFSFTLRAKTHLAGLTSILKTPANMASKISHKLSLVTTGAFLLAGLFSHALNFGFGPFPALFFFPLDIGSIPLLPLLFYSW